MRDWVVMLGVAFAGLLAKAETADEILRRDWLRQAEPLPRRHGEALAFWRRRRCLRRQPSCARACRCVSTSISLPP